MTRPTLIPPAAIRAMAQGNVHMQQLVQALRQHHGFTEAHARRFTERLVSLVLHDAADAYGGHLSATLDRLGVLREQVSTLHDAVLAGRGLPPDITPARLEQLFGQMETVLGQLVSPSQRLAHSDAPLVRDDAVSRALADVHADVAPAGVPTVAARPAPPHPVVADAQRAALQGLPAPVRAAMAEAAGLAPDLMRRAINAETETMRSAALAELAAIQRSHGVGEPRIQSAREGLEAMNLATRAAHRDPASPLGALDAATRARAVDAITDPALQAAVRGVKYLEKLAHDSPEHLAELWAQYRATPMQRTFRQYILGRMVSHMRGMHGEFLAAFQLGEGLTLLKGPDYDVTIPGTDLVGVTRSGEVWLIDNKAMTTPELESVGSLTRNLPQNMADDVGDFQTGLAAMPSPDPNVVAAVARLSTATHAIRALTAGMTPDQVNTTAVQAAIDTICAANRVRRVVTNAGGQVTGLSRGLQQRGIELRDLLQ